MNTISLLPLSPLFLQRCLKTSWGGLPDPKTGSRIPWTWLVTGGSYRCLCLWLCLQNSWLIQGKPMRKLGVSSGQPQIHRFSHRWKWNSTLNRIGLFCNPVDCNLPGSSVCGILQARILEWVVIPLSRGSSLLRYRTQVSCMAGRFFTVWAIREEATQVEPLKSSRTESPQKWLWYLSTLVQSCLKILKTVQLREHWHWRPWHFYVHFWWRRIWSGHISDLFPWQRYPLKEKLFR